MLNLIPGSLNVFNPNVGLKTDFVTKYGNIASKYNYLDPLGNQKFDTTWPLLVGIIGLFAAGASFIASRPKIIITDTNAYGKITTTNTTNTTNPERTPMQKTLQKVWWTLLCVAIIFLIYAAIKYFKDYKPQYNSWLKELPNEAKASLNTISAIDAIQNTVTNTNLKRSY